MDTVAATTEAGAESARGSASAWVPLPAPNGRLLRLLGPPPEKSAAVVHPCVKLDGLIGLGQSFVAGVCTSEGELLAPMELMLIDPDAFADCAPIPPAAVTQRLRQLPALYSQLRGGPPGTQPAGTQSPGAQSTLAALPGMDVAGLGIGEPVRLGPLLYCRKRHMLFAARSPGTLRPLTGVSNGDEPAGAAGGGDARLDPLLLVWDGPGGDGQVRIFGGQGGASELGDVQSLEELIKAQGAVAVRAAELAESEPLLFDELLREHPCCTRDERELTRLSSGGYDFVLERLALISTGEMDVQPLPLGEFRLDEASRMIGRTRPTQVVRPDLESAHDFDAWRGRRAERIESRGPMLLLAGEEDGRDLVEVCRVKLGLIEQAFTQLAAAWERTGHAHLCWNDETIRVAWREPAATPAGCWGFQSILRKIGLQPATTLTNAEGERIAYPPLFSAEPLMPPEAVEAARYFDSAGKGGLFIKKSTPESDKATRVQVLLEDTNIPRRLFCTADLLQADGQGWWATLAPAAEHNPDDGAGLPFAGRIEGRIAAIKRGEQFADCSYRWYPRFGEACDLHALGMLLFQVMLSHDDRSAERLFEAVLAERQELQERCARVEETNRRHEALSWIAGRCESDAPAALWSRRNVLDRREERASARLDSFPPLLFRAVITLGFRMTTAIRGFSFCPDRAHDVPRTAGGLPLPLVEMRGLVALFDDILFGRCASVKKLRASVEGLEG